MEFLDSMGEKLVSWQQPSYTVVRNCASLTYSGRAESVRGRFDSSFSATVRYAVP